MFPPFPEEEARKYSFLLMEQLGKGILPEHISLPDEFEPAEKYESASRKAHTEGKMFGVLVCMDVQEKRKILKAFSGQYEGEWNIPGWAPALLDPGKWQETVLLRNVQIHELSEKIRNSSDESEKKRLKAARTELSAISLTAIYGLYHFYCADGQLRCFSDLQLSRNIPTGTGDCCAPKLLNCAYQHALTPVSMAEFYYGNPGPAEKRKPENFYPPCDEKCRLILPAILGIEIIYRDAAIIVVNKPSGLLSVPGRGMENQDCVVNRVKRLFPSCIEQPSVHRLDQDTSGLLVLAFTKEAHRRLSMQFQNREIKKEYTALLRGKLDEQCGSSVAPGQKEGCIELKFRLDPDNRPYQIYDEENGKLGITLWKRIRYQHYRGEICTRVRFIPLTGRTHQLRLAAASKQGLGHPVAGDRLYGERRAGEHLLLHAGMLEFLHPETGKTMHFETTPDF